VVFGTFCLIIKKPRVFVMVSGAQMKLLTFLCIGYLQVEVICAKMATFNILARKLALPTSWKETEGELERLEIVVRMVTFCC